MTRKECVTLGAVGNLGEQRGTEDLDGSQVLGLPPGAAELSGAQAPLGQMRAGL